MTGFCVHSGTMAPPAIKQAVNFPPLAVSCSARAGSLTPVFTQGFSLPSLPVTPMLMFLSLSAELPAETKPHHFVAFQLHKALPPLKHLTAYEFINIYIYIFHLHTQVKLPLQPLQSSQVSRDNSGTTLSQREKNFFLSQPLDFNKSLGSLHITNGTWIFFFFF